MEWTGDEKAEKPHSLTTIAKGTSLTGEHGEVSNVEKNEGTSNMQLIAIVLSILAIVSSVGTCVLWYVVKISNNDKKEPTISRLLLINLLHFNPLPYSKCFRLYIYETNTHYNK